MQSDQQPGETPETLTTFKGFGKDFACDPPGGKRVEWILKAAKGNTATGYRGHAAATGYRGHAAATGDSGHAAATGYSGHAAATGDSGHAAATGDRGHAETKGQHAIACALGYASSAKASAGGAIMLAAWNDNLELVAVFASKVGENGIEPDVTYRLGLDGKPVAVRP